VFRWTDAAGRKGIGGYLSQAIDHPLDFLDPRFAFSGRIPRHYRDKHINAKQMMAALKAIELWGPQLLGNQRLFLFIYNAAVVGGLTKHSVRGEAMAPLRKHLLLTAVLDIELVPRWIPTTENILADALSRHEWRKIAHISPMLTQTGLRTPRRMHDHAENSARPAVDHSTAVGHPPADPPPSCYRDLPELSRPAARYLWWGLSNTTRKTCNTARRSNTTYCALNEPRIPASRVTVPLICNWVASLRGRVEPATMKSYITGLRNLHVDMSLPTDGIFDHARLQPIIHGARRFHDETGTRERLPITHDVLLKILQCLPHWRTDLLQASLYAAFCLAFAGFLRVGKFTWME
jgi:hypothetical protein